MAKAAMAFGCGASHGRRTALYAAARVLTYPVVLNARLGTCRNSVNLLNLRGPAHYIGGCGIAARRSRVYSAFGATSTSSVAPCSTISPARMTMTRSHSRRTTLRSWETNR
jgi:hypothetical protein